MKRVAELTLDWDDLQCFLAIARTGTLSRAGSDLGVTQPTMGRRLDRLHQRAGALLLQKTPTGFELTTAGEHILAHVQRMEEEAHTAGRILMGEKQGLVGEVRIATVEAFAAAIIAPALPGFLNTHPGLKIELDVDTRNLSLTRREADIAIRMAPFKQHEIIVRNASELAFGLYAAETYETDTIGSALKSNGEGLKTIGLQANLQDTPEGEYQRVALGKADCVLRTNSRESQLQACVGGIGIACLPRYIADPVAGLTLLTTREPPPSRGVWVGYHKDTRASARIREVLVFVQETIMAAQPRLAPS